MSRFERPFADSPRLGDILDPERNNFGALRCLMAALVLISHSYFFATGQPTAEPLTAWTGWSLGEHAVQVFFFMSGLMVAQSLDRSRSAADFLLARGLRIFPGLATCVVLTAFCLGPVTTADSQTQYFMNLQLPAYLIKTLSLSTGSAPLPGVFTGNPAPGLVNMSLWTLKYEAICYLLLACAGLAGVMRRPRDFALLLAAILLALGLAVSAPERAEDYAFLDNVRYFVIFFGSGVLAYLMRAQLVLSGWLVAGSAVLFVVAFDTPLKELVTALFLGYAVFWIASKPLGPIRSFCNRVDLSYGIYIYGAPIQQTALALSPGLSPIEVAVIGLAFAVPLAVLSWVLIESPALLARKPIRSAIEAVLSRRQSQADPTRS